MIYINNVKDFEKEVLNSTIPVLVDFYADWCGPCRILGPVLEKLETTNNGKIKIAKVNVDNNPDLSMQYGVQAIPTVVIIKNGNVVCEFIGVKNITEYQSMIDEVINS